MINRYHQQKFDEAKKQSLQEEDDINSLGIDFNNFDIDDFEGLDDSFDSLDDISDQPKTKKGGSKKRKKHKKKKYSQKYIRLLVYLLFGVKY